MHPISKRKKSETKKGCHSIIHPDMAVKTLTWNLELIAKLLQLFHNGGRYHIETSPLICFANQWTGSYMITDSVMKELKRLGLFNLISF